MDQPRRLAQSPKYALVDERLRKRRRGELADYINDRRRNDDNHCSYTDIAHQLTDLTSVSVTHESVRHWHIALGRDVTDSEDSIDA